MAEYLIKRFYNDSGVPVPSEYENSLGSGDTGIGSTEYAGKEIRYRVTNTGGNRHTVRVDVFDKERLRWNENIVIYPGDNDRASNARDEIKKLLG